MKKIVIATQNQHKLAEMEQKITALAIPGLQFASLNDYPDYQAPPEDGLTFEQNALLKARAVAQMSGEIALADDSGLCVAALQGAPGVYSARYAGVEHDDAANNRKLLAELAHVPDAQRQAAFHCVIAIVCPDGRYACAEGQVEGLILSELRGTAGFGYDPLFYLPQAQVTMAELPLTEKNRISHRALALEKALPLLAELLKD